MKKILFSLAVTSALYSYSQSLPAYQLPAPGTSSSVYNNSNNMRNIIYGRTPSNFNGKTLVFMHGFSSTSSTFLLDNDMYEEAYKAGFKTAFVSATKGEGDWVNGEILSRAIDQIKSYLGTSTVTIVAHSNGGKASEVAMFEYNKAASVDRVVTLSTPFRGTQIADVASSPAIGWLTSLLGLGTGAGYSTTYYCDSYFRPYFDNKSNNLPKKFYNVGAWGYGRFFGDSSYAMIPAGGIIYAAGGGKNDGVTPFYSSTRPGGKQVFSSSDDRTYLNHSDIKISDEVWDDIVKPILGGSYGKMDEDPNENSNIKTSNHKVSSNYQILNSNQDTYVLLSAKSKQYQLQAITERENENLTIVDAVTLRQLNHFSVNKENQAYQKLNKTSPSSQKLKINASGNYVAFVTDDVDEPMNYSISSNNILTLNFPKTPEAKQQQITITAKAHLIGGLRDQKLPLQEFDIQFDRKGQDFVANVDQLPEGVYSLRASAEIKNEYKRDLISGFVISNQKSNIIKNETITLRAENNFKLSNNPINETTQIISETELSGNVHVKVYNNFGQIVEEFNTSGKGIKSVLVGNHFSKLAKGLYIIEVSNADLKQQFKVLK